MTGKLLHQIAALPARPGVRLVALSYLEDAEAARERLLRSRDAEALHDFRVALRRLRSLLRAWRPWVDDSVKRADRHRLREIAGATGRARDLEVQRAWLSQAALPPDVARGAERLGALLERQQLEAERDAARATHQFPEAAARLRDRLAHYRETLDPHRPGISETCGQVAAALTAGLLSELRADFERVRASGDAPSAHAARITGKRLRYLLEPFRDDLDNGKKLMQRLRSLQDDLGGLHDLDVILGVIAAQSATGPRDEAGVADTTLAADTSLAALASFAQARREEAMARLRQHWLGARGAVLFRDVAAAADQLGAFAPPPLEIERKYLLRAVPRGRAPAVRRIDQGWLPGQRVLERVRRVYDKDGTRYYRTVKLGQGLVRTEIEEEIDAALFRRLWRLTRGRRVSKRRYQFSYGEQTWEVDRFIGRDLVLAEIELPAASTEVTLPAWLARYVIREVTGDPRYVNVNLAG